MTMGVNGRFVQACSEGDIEVFNSLLTLADLNNVETGSTPLIAAVIGNNQEIISRLLNHPGVSVNVSDKDGWTALHHACFQNRVGVVESICTTRGVNINIQDRINGRTPLMVAVMGESMAVISKMVKMTDICLFLTDNNGEDVMDIARKNSSVEAIALIQETINGIVNREASEEKENLDEINVEGNEEELEQSIASVLDLVERTKAERKDNAAKLEILTKRHREETVLLLRKQSREAGKISEQHKREIAHLESCQIKERNMIEENDKDICDKLKNIKTQLDLLTSPTTSVLPCPECPICLEYMRPPMKIVQCNNGHLICQSCSEMERIETCPTCRENFTGRATAMEQHLRILFRME